IFTVQKNIVEAKPTVMLSIPRLYEAMYDRIHDTASKATGVRKRLFHWAMKVGQARSTAMRQGKRANPLLALQYALADRLVLSKIREKVTGGNLRYFVSGGAALRPNIGEFFHALGIIILEGYGLTETAPVICVNRPENLKFGTVGPPLPGVEVMIAEDGEILSRGPHIMEGYHHKPEETQNVIDGEGWFHTGDIGRLDEQGRLRITDRKKDLIVLATGKNVAPQPIETAIKESPYIAEAALFGDNQNVISALIAPNIDALKAYAQEKNIGVSEPGDLVRHPEVKKLIKAEIDRATTGFADFEKVRKFTLLDHNFTDHPDLITPTLKLKRQLVKEKYAREIAAMSGGAE
ncbi:MAG: AMP-binding protein, partial [Armatimonadetes bacterium]|nr:AMP-binding protein [Armatimonadota bacterium]